MRIIQKGKYVWRKLIGDKEINLNFTKETLLMAEFCR